MIKEYYRYQNKISTLIAGIQVIVFTLLYSLNDNKFDFLQSILTSQSSLFSFSKKNFSCHYQILSYEDKLGLLLYCAAIFFSIISLIASIIFVFAIKRVDIFFKAKAVDVIACFFIVLAMLFVIISGFLYYCKGNAFFSIIYPPDFRGNLIFMLCVSAFTIFVLNLIVAIKSAFQAR